MTGSYLAILDSLIAAGCERFSPGFRESQTRWLASSQRADGGFAGRMGESDTYYTDFAVRLLATLAPDNTALSRVAQYLAQLDPTPGDAIDCFCRLNIARGLERCDVPCSLDAAVIAARLAALRLPCGAYARHGGEEPSAYYTFLAALSGEMLDTETVSAEGLAAIQALRKPDGGFTDLPNERMGQTSSTAAGVGTLSVCGLLDAPTGSEAAGFLARLQSADGGFLAHPAAYFSDLLSTFTALWTLLALGEEGKADLANAARYVSRLALPEGGFLACDGDTEADVEYAYYGVATLSLLREHLANRAEEMG